jgi:hypothetical protein
VLLVLYGPLLGASGIAPMTGENLLVLVYSIFLMSKAYGKASIGHVAVLIHTCKRELSPTHLVCPWRHNA